jgi:hypothetical protein
MDTPPLFRLNDLPAEVKLVVLDHLAPQDVARVRSINAHFRNVVDRHPRAVSLDDLSVQDALQYTERFSEHTRRPVIQTFMDYATPERGEDIDHRAHILAACARYGDHDQRDAIWAAATKEAFEDPSVRANVLGPLAEYGNERHREMVLEEATPENFPEEDDRASLYMSVAENGTANIRNEVRERAADGFNDAHRASILMVAGNDGDRDEILGTVTELDADSYELSSILAAGARHGNARHRDQVLGILQDEDVQEALDGFGDGDKLLVRPLI